MGMKTKLPHLLMLIFLHSAALAQPVWFACAIAGDEAVYTQQASGTECQRAKRTMPVADVLEEAQTAVVRQMWYQNEFGNINENEVAALPSRATNPSRAPALHQPISTAPAKPPTAQALIRRDIAAEERARLQARKQWQQAQQQGNTSQAAYWQNIIADYEANIRALRQELVR